MSETVETEGVARRSRAERPAREVHRQEPEISIEDSGAPTPEAALEDTARQLKEANARASEAQRRAEAAERARQQAEAQRDQAAGNQAQDRQSVVAAAIESAKADGEAAELAFRTARDAGNLDAEIAAQRRLTAAEYRFNQATAELAQLKAFAARPQPAPTPQASGLSPESEAWLRDNPRFFNDKEFHDYAMWMHQKAINEAGLREGSREYVDYIDRAVKVRFSEGREPMAQEPRRGDGAPPSRGNSAGGNAGWKRVRTGLGEVQYMDKPGGGRTIRMDADTRERFDEGARLDRSYDRDPAKALADYTNEHINMALENYQDEAGAYMKTGDGEYMR
jgi:hypothetical protein